MHSTGGEGRSRKLTHSYTPFVCVHLVKLYLWGHFTSTVVVGTLSEKVFCVSQFNLESGLELGLGLRSGSSWTSDLLRLSDRQRSF